MRNQDFKKPVFFIDADVEFNWLDFQMSDEKKKKLFLSGAAKELEFIRDFD